MSNQERVDGARELVAALETAGVQVCFGLPGVHNLPIWAALGRSPIRLVGVRHEQTAAYAADGYARTSGRVGIALTTTGPGAANTLAALGEAYASGSPVLVIATEIPTRLRRDGVLRGVLHETRDQAAMFAPVVKETIRVATRADIHGAVLRAVGKALAAPAGPVYLEVPTDLLGELGPATLGGSVGSDPPATLDGAELDEAERLLTSARRPLLWVGGGAASAGAEDAIGRLAAALGAPILETYAGRGIVPPDHPGHVGLPPHVPEAGELWDDADVVLALGTDFDGMMTQNWRMPAPPCLIAVNVDAEAAAKAYAPALTLVGDARAVVEGLAARVAGRAARSWAGDLGARRAGALARLAAEDATSAAFMESLAASVPADATVVCDMCIPGYWVGGFHAFARPRALAYPIGWGTLGFGFPASLGAALAADGPTLCICGDGGFMFACGELATVVQERLPVCILLVDDGGYGMLRYDQLVAGDEPLGTELATPDWVALGRSFGLAVERIEDPGMPLSAALDRGLAGGVPSMVVLDAAMAPPPTTSPRWYRAANENSTMEVAA